MGSGTAEDITVVLLKVTPVGSHRGEDMGGFKVAGLQMTAIIRTRKIHTGIVF